MCLCFPECTYVCYMCIGAHGGQKSTRSPGNGVRGGYELPCGNWKPILGPLEEKVFLTTEQFLQPLIAFFLFFKQYFFIYPITLLSSITY